MATISAYTTIEQSHKLAEILPLESADMCYILHASSDNPDWRFDNDIPPMVLGKISINELTVKALPCWSLSALLDVLNKSAYFINNEAGIVELSSIKATKWSVSILNCGKIEDCYADNPVDACVIMIERLHELNLL